MKPDDAVIECLRNLAVTVRERGISSTALAMLPLEQLPEDAPVPEPLLLLYNAKLSPEATAELLERAALRRDGQTAPAVEGAPPDMLERLDGAIELIAEHLQQVMHQAADRSAVADDSIAKASTNGSGIHRT